MHPVYLTPLECLISLFNLPVPGAEERLRRELAGWRGLASAERLINGHIVLVVRPG